MVKVQVETSKNIQITLALVFVSKLFKNSISCVPKYVDTCETSVYSC